MKNMWELSELIHAVAKLFCENITVPPKKLNRN